MSLSLSLSVTIVERYKTTTDEMKQGLKRNGSFGVNKSIDKLCYLKCTPIDTK